MSKKPSINKIASLVHSPFSYALIEGFSDYLQKLAQMTVSSVAPKPTISMARMPRNTLSAKTPSYTQINQPSAPGPAQMHQPLMNPPAVHG